jgi:hypothetical protein
MSKSFTHAGVSRLDGEMKVRFANDALRTKVLVKNGHKDIDIVELKHAMTKEEAVAYLISIDFATQNGKTNADVKAALEAELEKRTVTPKAANKQPKKTKEAKKPAKAPAKKAAPSMEAIKAKADAARKAKTVAEMEDAPF